MVEHLRERLPEQCKVVVVEAGFVGEVGADEAVATIEAIGDEVLTAHRLVGSIRFFGLGHGHARDAQVERQDGVNAAAEAELHRAANLAGIGAGGHDRSKGADIVVAFAHFRAGDCHLLAVGLLLLAVHVVLQSACGRPESFVQHRTLLDEDVERRLRRLWRAGRSSESCA